jgi:outer membrane autotransporter protein
MTGATAVFAIQNNGTEAKTGGSIGGDGAGILVDDVTNLGQFAISNSLGGTITGTGGDGVAISNVTMTGDLPVLSILNVGTETQVGGTITGSDDGIQLYTLSGVSQVVVNNILGGSITGTAGHGMDISDITLTGAGSFVAVHNTGSPTGGGGTITGGVDGVIINAITSVTHVLVDNSLGGTVTGTAGKGIDIGNVNLVGDGATLEILNNGTETKDGGTITGEGAGIQVTTVTGAGTVGVANSYGGTIRGGTGLGIALVDIAGSVTVSNEEDGLIEGGTDGILASAAGDVMILSNGGTVTAGTGYGMYLRSSAGEIGVGAGDITAGLDGVNAEATVGEIGVTVFGDIVSSGGDGVAARSLGSGPVAIGVAGSIDAQASAINVEIVGSSGTAKASIEIDGETQGGATGLTDATIRSATVDGTDIVVYSGGVVSGADGAADALIVNVEGGAAAIDNYGSMTGRLDLTAGADVVRNWSEQTWVTSGVSDFGDGFDELVNPGRIVVVGAAEFANLELFRNADPSNPDNPGILAMRDGSTAGRLTVAGDYDGGAGSLITIDVDFGSGKADLLTIGGSASGVTWVQPNILGGGAFPTGPNPEGVRIVDVSAAGDAEATNFQLLGGPVDVGFFSYDLSFDDAENDFYLSNTPGARAYELPTIVTAAQETFHESNQVWLDRTADLRGADRGAGAPGFWIRSFGSRLDRSASSIDTAAGSSDADSYTQTTWGVQAGFDTALTEPGAEGGTIIVGVLGGWVESRKSAGDTGSSADLSGPQLGLYATYLNGGFFADLLLKAEFLDLDYDTGFGAGDAGHDGADVTNLGAVLDMGYRFDFDAFFVEPQATLAYVSSDVADLALLGTDVSFDSGESMRGRLGIRVGGSLSAGSETVVEPYLAASVWNEFSGDNTATISGAGSSMWLSDDGSATWGVLSAGVDVVDLGGGASAFLRADWRFGGETTGGGLQGGLRLSW